MPLKTRFLLAVKVVLLPYLVCLGIAFRSDIGAFEKIAP